MVMVLDHKSMAMNLRFPEDLDRGLDQVAAEEHTSKSALLLQGAELVLRRQRSRPGGVEAYPKYRGRRRLNGVGGAVQFPGRRQQANCVTLMVLMLWNNGCRHDFSTAAAFDLVEGAAASDVSLQDKRQLREGFRYLAVDATPRTPTT